MLLDELLVNRRQVLKPVAEEWREECLTKALDFLKLGELLYCNLYVPQNLGQHRINVLIHPEDRLIYSRVHKSAEIDQEFFLTSTLNADAGKVRLNLDKPARLILLKQIGNTIVGKIRFADTLHLHQFSASPFSLKELGRQRQTDVNNGVQLAGRMTPVKKWEKALTELAGDGGHAKKKQKRPLNSN
jgi:hypothetical protein